MLASIKPNDRVVTSGGILGTVTRVNEKAFSGEDVIVIRVDERVKIEVLRSGIVRVVRDESGSATTSNA
jgi:preprotein translocase subunit YajC